MPTSPAEPSDAAAFYEKELMDFFGSVDPPFDVLLLGMGADGHVASLFPGSPALLERKRLVVTSEAPNPPRTRLSLTFRAINSAMAILLLIAGGEKKEILSWLDQSEHRKTFPVSRVAGKQRLLWFLDQSAAGLPGSS